MSHLYKQKAVYWIGFYRQGKLYRESLKTKDKATAKYLQAKKDQGISENKYTTIDPHVETILNEYNLAVQHHKRTATHYRDMQNIKRFFNATHIQKINAITEKSLQDYFNGCVSAGLAISTVNRNMASIKAFLNFALRRKHISSNPMQEIKQYRTAKNPPRFLNKDEVKAVLKEAKKEDLYPCVATAIYTGMRQAELFNLEWSDVDFTRDTITVQNKEDFQTKSKKFRVIPLHPVLKSILRPYREKEGRCFDTVNQRRAFGRIMRGAEIKDAGWHTMRHTFASLLAMAGVDLVTISQLLGHASISTTMIYGHLTKGHVKSAVEKLRL